MAATNSFKLSLTRIKFHVILIFFVISCQSSTDFDPVAITNNNISNSSGGAGSDIFNTNTNVNDLNEFGEQEITSLLNYTLQSAVQNASLFKEEAKHSIILTHRNQHWVEQVAKKLAPLFSVISLWNEKCWTQGYDQGTCYSRNECINKGGKPGGYCAGGFGVCCIFSYTCDSSTYFNRTYFMNSDFPHGSHDVGLCTHSAIKLVDICQIRLDFEIFELERPESTGLCLKDMFHVEGIDYHLPPLCGDLTGHHVYLPVGFESEVKLVMVFSPGNSLKRWKIRTTRMRCNSAMLSPGGCMQYHQGVVGRITSFNYVDGVESNMNKLNYGVCVRREKGFCAVQWSVCDDHKKKRKRRNVEEKKYGGVEQQMNQLSTASVLRPNKLIRRKLSKKLWDTGYDSQTQEDKLCRDLARNSTTLYARNSTTGFLQRISCPTPSPAGVMSYDMNNAVADSSWRPFIPPSNYFSQNHVQKRPPQNSINHKNIQKIGNKLGSLLVQSGSTFHSNKLNGPIRLQPVGSHVFEKVQHQYPSYSTKVTYGTYNTKPQTSLTSHKNSSSHLTTANHAYGPTFRQPVSSISPELQNSLQQPMEGTEKPPLFGTIYRPKEPELIKSKHHHISFSKSNKTIKVFKKGVGNKIKLIVKPSHSVAFGSLTDKLQALPKPSLPQPITSLSDKVHTFAKPITTAGIKGSVVNKIQAHPKPVSTFIGDKGLVGRIPVHPKPPPTTGLKGGLANKIHEKPKLPVSGASLLLPGKIKENPKLPPSGAALLKPGKIKVNPKPPVSGASLFKPGKIVQKPKLPLKGSGFGLFGRPKVKPKLKYKYPYNLKKHRVKPKPHKPGGCQNKTRLIFVPVPIPLPIPIPIPIVPVVVVPFPFGVDPEGGGGGGGDPHGWSEHNDHVFSVTEPYLIRIVTDKKRDEGLSSFCMDWEQISCDSWHQHPQYLKYQEEHEDEDDNYYYDDPQDNNTHEDYREDNFHYY